MSTQRYINYDGKLYPENEKVFTINNRAFKYGDAVFETIRVINGQPVFVHDHFTRLKKGMDLLRMNTIPLTFEELYEQILHLIEKNKITEGARVRITVFRVGEGLYTPINDTKSYVIEAIPISKNLYELNEEGLHIDLYTDIKVHPTILTQIKTTNKIPNVLTGIYKKEHGLDDCLMINEQHHIVEAISSNVFLYKNNTLYTPSISEGCIDGITRKHIIEVANSMNITVIEGAVTGSMLLQTDELFLTNSIAGIKWVKEHRGKFYTNETTKLILEKFNEVVS